MNIKKLFPDHPHDSFQTFVGETAYLRVRGYGYERGGLGRRNHIGIISIAPIDALSVFDEDYLYDNNDDPFDAACLIDEDSPHAYGIINALAFYNSYTAIPHMLFEWTYCNKIRQELGLHKITQSIEPIAQWFDASIIREESN